MTSNCAWRVSKGGLAVAALSLAATFASHAESANIASAIIPIPAKVQTQAGEFQLLATTPIVVAKNDKEALRAAQQIRDLIGRTYGVQLPLVQGQAKGAAIEFVRDARGGFGPEAYRLQVAPGRITLRAATANGLFYAGVSLWQMLNKTPEKTFKPLPVVLIDDAPRFGWRGLMLDSARHFQSPQYIRHFIDWMAVHKLNTLHWHLTDDQAWRLEIKKYPRLTEVAAWRVPAGAAAQADIDPATGKPRLYGGFYTQETVRDLVRYAAARAITIVPEIEIPGHATATLAAYPQLASITNPPKAVPADWGIYPNAYNPEEATFTFLQNVLVEVMALFPSHYIHVGGDEVEKTQWQESAEVQARMKQLGIAKTADLQTYFTQRMGRFLQAHGRRLVGWDEVLLPGLPNHSIVMSWRGIDGALSAASQGFDTILSPWPTLYFDNRQSDAMDQPPGRVRIISLRDVYAFEPMPEKLLPDQRKHVLGLQANVWTEHIRSEDRVTAMTFPRAIAVAELGWSQPEKRSWPDFRKRVTALAGHYRALQMPFDQGAFAPQVNVQYTGNAATVTLSLEEPFGDIRYTLDGSDPTSLSPIYQNPLTINLPGQMRAATFAELERLSQIVSVPLQKELMQRRASRQLKLCSEGIPIFLEDDGPVQGPRAVFKADIQHPCWIFEQADLGNVGDITAGVGQVPFNFQVGDLVNKMVFAQPQTPSGELEVHIDDCKGEVIARMPLTPALTSNAVTTLPPLAIAPRAGKHDLCLMFAQKFSYAAGDPLWMLGWIQLNERAPASSNPAPAVSSKAP